MPSTKPGKILTAAEIDAASQEFSHPWNPRSEVRGARMSQLTGLERSGISRAVLQPGKESFVYHSHTFEEEWIYILAGTATLEMDDEEHSLGPGDFVGFPTPSVAHHLRNTGEQPLVYLMGGESKEIEVADFPRLGKRMVRLSDRIDIVDIGAIQPFGPLADEPDP